jgi:hypothetical protein
MKFVMNILIELIKGPGDKGLLLKFGKGQNKDEAKCSKCMLRF